MSIENINIMRNLITFLILLTSLVSLSQNGKLKKSNSGGVNENSRIVREFVPPNDNNRATYNDVEEPNFDKKLVFIEIAHLLDSIREYMYDQKFLETKIDVNASKGAEHHCKYLKNLIDIKNPKIDGFITHNEFKKDGTCEYLGNDTLIFDWAKRMTYFAKDSMGFIGEVCSVGSLKIISYKGLTPKEIAKNIIFDFYHSKEHWDILTYYGYTEIALDIEIKKDFYGYFTYWFTMAVGYDIKISKKLHKSKFYFPGNQLGLTEYYEEINRVCTFNELKIKKPTLK